jgi:carbonic anhydrase
MDVHSLHAGNAAWATRMLEDDPQFFVKRESSQLPSFLWIGCSDSRVSAESLTGGQPGDMFVHRNIGNQVWSTDLNVLSVLQYAVHALDVQHIIVAGHTNCGALRAASGPSKVGVVDHWLSNIRNTIRWHREELDAIPDERSRLDRLARLKVMQQVGILSRTPTVLDAWARGKRPVLHGTVYHVADGRLAPVIEDIDSVEKAARLLLQN